MKRFTLENDLWVPAALPEVWEFCSNPPNLAKLSPKFYNIKVPANASTEEGAQFTIEMHPFGFPLPLKWVSHIEKVECDLASKCLFIDRQLKGPFSYWKHEHIFESAAKEIASTEESRAPTKARNPGTWIKDRVEYAVPFGEIGQLAHRWAIRRSLENMFFHRSKMIRLHFASSEISPSEG